MLSAFTGAKTCRGCQRGYLETTALQTPTFRKRQSSAAGVVRGDVSVDVGTDRVLDLDPGDVELGAVVAHDDISRLPDVKPGVGCAR